MKFLILLIAFSVEVEASFKLPFLLNPVNRALKQMQGNWTLDHSQNNGLRCSETISISEIESNDYEIKWSEVTYDELRSITTKFKQEEQYTERVSKPSYSLKSDLLVNSTNSECLVKNGIDQCLQRIENHTNAMVDENGALLFSYSEYFIGLSGVYNGDFEHTENFMFELSENRLIYGNTYNLVDRSNFSQLHFKYFTVPYNEKCFYEK